MTLKSPETWQYRISSGADPGDHAADGQRLWGGLHLSVGPGLGMHRLHDASGADAGILLGFPIDLQTGRLPGDEPIALDRDVDADPEGFAAQVMARFGGRHVWIWNAPSGPRLYLDCAGQIPCVYHPAARIAGTTADTVLDDTDYEQSFDAEFHAAMKVETAAGYGVGGLTMHRGLHRVMPNFYLDLDRWETVRHWPGPGGMPGEVADPVRAVAEIVSIVQVQYRALLDAPKRLAIALTAGRDTRMLLACARPMAREVDFVTVAAGGVYGRDTVVAQRIAEAEGLGYRMLPRIRSTPEARRAYLRRAGDAVADANADFFPSVHPIADSHNLAGGAGGEIARGFLWRKAVPGSETLTPNYLLRRLGLEAPPRAREAMADWLAALPAATTPAQVLDLAYIEHRMGHWAGAQFCSDPGLVRYAPFLTRRGVDLMLGLPAAWKLEKRMSAEMVRQAWPELARFPINSLGRRGDMMHLVHRALQNPAAVRRKILALLRLD